MLNNEYKKKVIKELENISTEELINLLQEVGSTRVDDGKNVESDFEGGCRECLTKKNYTIVQGK